MRRTSKLRRGYGAFQRLSSRMPTTRSLWAYLISSTTCSKGMCVEVRACAMDPMQVFPAGRAVSAEGGWPYTEATPSGAAPTSPPEGVFRHKRRMELVELSGRITGRLGYTWPTTAYIIGRTAMLALRYSIISATTAARTRPQ